MDSADWNPPITSGFIFKTAVVLTRFRDIAIFSRTADFSDLYVRMDVCYGPNALSDEKVAWIEIRTPSDCPIYRCRP